MRDQKGDRGRRRAFRPEDPRALRHEVLVATRAALGCEDAAWLDYVPSETGGLRLARFLTLVEDGAVDAALRRMQAAPRIDWPWRAGRSPRLPRKRWVNRFVTPRSDGRSAWERFHASPYVERYLRPFGIRDQCRMLAYEGERLVGCVVGYSLSGPEAFTKVALRRANAIRQGIRVILAASVQLERESGLAEPAEVVLARGGEPRYWTPSASGWIESSRGRGLLADWGAAIAEGHAPETFHDAGLSARWSPLDGRSPEAFLLRISPSPEVLRARSYALSDAELDVAAALADGATVEEVAQRSGRSLETMRTHRRNLYRKLGVGSRAELARTLREGVG